MVNRRMCFRRLGHFVAGVLGIFYFGVDKPDRHYEHKQHAFDSYCKKVLKYEAYNGYREISRRQKYEALFSELSGGELAQLAV